MKKFNVIYFDFNRREICEYDIMPYLHDCYKEIRKKDERPKTFDEFKEFIRGKAMYMWWGRCEYEIYISGFPYLDMQEKWDIYRQVMMNIDIVTEIFMEGVRR